jgi:aminoglycoside phosphotransferase (APT) family kinase protein
MKASDDSGAVRPGEALDVAAADAWLRARIPELAGPPLVTQYRGGASNWTYRLSYPDFDFVLRRPPAGTKAKSAHDMSREYRVQSALAAFYPWVPKMVGLCEDESVIGAPFYVMHCIAGIILRRRLPVGLAFDEGMARALCVNALDKLVALHRVDYRAAGLEALARGEGYAKRQIAGWSDRYEKARTWNVPTFRYVRDWLAEHVPEDVGSCVIHNDFRFDNLVLDAGSPTTIVGVLDWEMATVGDPLMDLGGALAYWVQASDDPIGRSLRRQPTDLPGMLSRHEIVELYCERTGLFPRNWAFYEVYGLFRLAVIAQQIYYRYHHGQTKNPSFRRFWLFAHYLAWRCRRLIGKA